MLVDEYYQYHLHKRSQEALEYYRDRGYSDDIIKKFSLGYAPKGYSQLVSQTKNIRWRDQIEKTIGYKMNDDELTDTIHVLLELAGVTKSMKMVHSIDLKTGLFSLSKTKQVKPYHLEGRRFRPDSNGAQVFEWFRFTSIS